MNARQFQEEVLGTWSSHPYGLARQRWLLLLAGLVPLLVTLAIGAVALTDLAGWKALLVHPTRWSLALACALAMGVGAAMMGMLANRVAHACARLGIAGKDDLPLHPGYVIVLALFWIAPLALSFVRRIWDGPYLSTALCVLHLLCLLPILVLIVWLSRPALADAQPGYRVVRRAIWLRLGCIVLALAALSLVVDLQSLLAGSSLARRLPWVTGPFSRLLIFATLATLALVCISVWQMWIRVERVESEPLKGVPASPHSSARGESAPPAWIAQVIANLPARCTADPAERMPTGETSNTLESDETLRILFGGFAPTERQSRFFSRFCASYLDSCFDPTTVKEKHRGDDIVSADLLLQGDAGSGRTTVLLACALYAAIARAQHVLVVVPDRARAVSVCQALSNRLARMFLDNYIRCDLVTEENVACWCNADGRGPEVQGLPQILVATPETVEGSLYCSKIAGKESLRALRRIILLLEVVLVDDFMDMDTTERCHLTFSLDKQRLLLASEHVAFQTVVATPKLAEKDGVEYLGAQLFTQKRLDTRNNVFELLPRRTSPAWVLTIRAADPPQASIDIVALCLSAGLNVVLFRKGLGGNDRIALEERLTREARVEAAKLRVISHADQPLGPMAPDRVDVVLFQTAMAGDAGAALRLRMGREDTVFIRLLGSDEVVETRKCEGIPVIADRSAVPLRTAHLRSVLRFIPPGTPVPTEVWSQFGLSVAGGRIDYGVPKGRLSAVWFFDDWHEKDRYHLDLWPYLALANEVVFHETIDVVVLPSDSETVFMNPRKAELFLGHLDPDGETAPTGLGPSARWVDKETGESLQREDLSHAAELCLSYGSSTFAPDILRTGRQGIELVANYWHGDGTDKFLPVSTLAWTMEPTHRAPEVWWDPGSGIGGYTARHCRGRFRTVRTEFKGLMTAYGDEHQVFLPPFFYPAYTSAIVLSPGIIDSEDPEPYLQVCLQGEWKTDAAHGFSWAMSYALAYAMHHLVPGWPFFARCLAFNLSGRNYPVGRFCVWLVEPANSGLSTMPLLKRVLESQDGRARLVDRARSLIDYLVQAPPERRTRVARQFAGVGFAGDRIDDADLAACNEVLADLKARLPGGMPPPERVGRPQAKESEDADNWPPVPAVPQPPDGDGRSTAGGKLPPCPIAGSGNMTLKWKHRGTGFSFQWGFASDADRRQYLDVLNKSWTTRISTPGLLGYILNDPYIDFVGGLGAGLETLYEGKGGDLEDRWKYAEYLLSFVQMLPYIPDPTGSGDWPRFPSETLACGGGDCEDLSLLYMALLCRSRIPNALLLMENHAAVGVAVECPSARPDVRANYRWGGRTYYYAETATQGDATLPLGQQPDAADPAAVIPAPFTGLPKRSDLQILNVIPTAPKVAVVVTAARNLKNVRIGAYARRATGVFDMQDALTCVGSGILPSCAEREIQTCTFTLDAVPIGGSCWIDILASVDGNVIGKFIGSLRLTVG